MMLLLRRLPFVSCPSHRSLKTLSDQGLVQDYGSSNKPKPVITLPVKVQERAFKRVQKLKHKFKHPDKFEGDRKRPVIRCRRQELDHFHRQTYSRSEALPLASEHWHSKRAHGDWFEFLAHQGARHRNDLTSKDFKETGLGDKVAAALERCGYRKPTFIQSRSIPEVLAGKSSLIATETGNGKTLAFLAPALQHALETKAALPCDKLNAPIVVIATPSRELAAQIANQAKDLAYSLGVDVRLELGGFINSRLSRDPREPTDVLVGTFGALNTLFEKRYYHRDNVRHLILDEADTLLDDTFNRESVPFIASFGMSSKSRRSNFIETQVTLVGATFPTNLGSILSSVCNEEDLTKISTDHLHHVLAHVRQSFIRTPPKRKEGYLLDALEKDLAKGRQAIVFSNEAQSAEFADRVMRRNNVKSCLLHSKLRAERREENLDKFLRGDCQVLSCTDLASRGLDTSNVSHVVNYEFPYTMSDYIHRVGRVGRVGSKQGSKVTNFVSGYIQVSQVQKIEEAVRRNQVLPNVNSNIIRIIQHRRRKRGERINERDDEEEGEEL